MSEFDLDELYNLLEFKECPVEAAFHVLGRKWAVSILREMLRGVSQFNRLEENIIGINPRILSMRLKDLQRFGIVQRRVISAAESPVRVEYQITELGHELEPILVAAAKFSMIRMPRRVFKDGKPRFPEELWAELED